MESSLDVQAVQGITGKTSKAKAFAQKKLKTTYTVSCSLCDLALFIVTLTSVLTVTSRQTFSLIMPWALTSTLPSILTTCSTKMTSSLSVRMTKLTSSLTTRLADSFVTGLPVLRHGVWTTLSHAGSVGGARPRSRARIRRLVHGIEQAGARFGGRLRALRRPAWRWHRVTMLVWVSTVG